MTPRPLRPALAFLAATLVAATLVTSPQVAGATSSTVPDTGSSLPSAEGDVDPNAVEGVDPTQIQVTESWTLAPAAAAGEAGNRPNLSYTIEPGGEVTDAVTVYNLGNVPLVFRVYPTDAFNNDDGTFAVLAGDKDPVDVGTWLTLDQGNISVPPGQQTTIPFTIKVPRDATPGDHVGAILASSPTKGNGENGATITVDRRTGTRLFVRVGGDLRSEVGIVGLDSSYDHAVSPFGGTVHATFRVENRGNVRVSGTPVVKAGGPFGLLAKTVKLPAISELLPGEHADLSVDISDVPALMVNSVDVSMLPESEGVESDVGTASSTLFAPPISILLLLLVGVIVLLALRVRRRRLAPAASANRQQPPSSERELQHQ
ncbi:MAG: WxL protein peptidoglycan domain-containing protein [Ilumatobacteraceae bacterium]